MVRCGPCASASTVNPSVAEHNPSKQWLGSPSIGAHQIYFSPAARFDFPVTSGYRWFYYGCMAAGLCAPSHAVVPIKRLAPLAPSELCTHVLCNAHNILCCMPPDPPDALDMGECSGCSPQGPICGRCMFSSFKPQPPHSELIAGVTSQSAQIFL